MRTVDLNLVNLTGSLALSLAGKDKGSVYVVLTCGFGAGQRLACADGRKRSVKNPKLKSVKHLRVLEGLKIADPQAMTNKALRKAITSCLSESGTFGNAPEDRLQRGDNSG